MINIMAEHKYYIGLIDTLNPVFDGLTKKYNQISSVYSGIHLYFPLLLHNLNERHNWHQITHSEAFEINSFDFCVSNFAKLQTISKFHYRILLDTEKHFISNKGEYCDTFKKYDFIINYKRFILKNNKMHFNDEIEKSFNNDDYIIIKPDKGTCGLGISIVQFKNIGTVNLNNHYKDWTISKIHLPRLYINPIQNKCLIVTNRIYFVITKINNVVSGYLYDEFVNYCAYDNFKNDMTDFEPINFQKRVLSNYVPPNCNEKDFYNNRFVSHKNYISIFTKEEFSIVFQKIKDYLKIITEKIANHILCSNDKYDNPIKETNGAFHIYGIDSIIDDSLNVKFIEINGAPLISKQYAFYETECMNYHILINELLKISVDIMFPPASSVTYNIDETHYYGCYKNSTKKERLFNQEFIKIHEFIVNPPPPHIFYISKQVSLKYPFILNGFLNSRRSFFYKRIKNPHYHKIDVFYGLRDLYETKFTSNKYYNELSEFNNCVCSRKAKILNKIQGVTFYLANKTRLYLKLIQMFNKKDVVCFHPPSVVIKIINNMKYCSTNSLKNIKLITEFIEDNPNKSLIIKPGNGSQGKGIIILKIINEPYLILNELVKIKTQFNYDTFLISSYIDNPKLCKSLKCGNNGRKFNIRYYVLLFLEDDELKVYLLNKQLVYYTILDYNTTEIPMQFQHFEQTDIDNMRSLTNLQLIYNINTKYGCQLDIVNYLDLMDDLRYEFGNETIENIHVQFKNILIKTLQSTQSEFRGLNRFVKDSSSFNFIGYDMLLDDNNVLHFIECNRGVDMVGLLKIVGDNTMVEIFEELFDITVDGKVENFNLFEKVDVAFFAE
jgi:glutathione synthase/RimK-type ligase-like ATP-grasp enzyme